MNPKTQKPFGLWPSPISPAALSLRTGLVDVQWGDDGKSLFWLEARSGRMVIVRRPEGSAMVDLTDTHSPAGGVGYGGGEFTVQGGTVVFAERNGRLHRCASQGEKPRPISPGFGDTASPAISPDGEQVLFVHTYERKDVIGLVDSRGKNWPSIVAQGADFYMQPAWHPSGRKIAWVEWDHPNMPWDGTRLVLATLDNACRVVEKQVIAGGEEQPAWQPSFSPDGRWLSYLTEAGEWERLVLLDLNSGETHILLDETCISTPAWVQGIRTYGWSPSSQRIFFVRNERGFASLWKVEIADRQAALLSDGPYTWLTQLAVSPADDRVAMIASSAQIAAQIVSWKDGQFQVERHSASDSLNPQDLPIPQAMTWISQDQEEVHGLYYPPSNAAFTADGLPPAIIYIHGGPTSSVTAGFAGDTAFFTSRGYAVLAVNYRGSTGYGRSYMCALRGRWGDLDVVDAVGGAQALVDRGLADPSRLVIRGGSAGGYTVLNALIRFPGFFKAGLCSYGVSNLFALNMETHKFEERYNDRMVGSLPEAAGKFHDWSPVFHADQIKDPIAVFQGSVDKVVPPNQSEMIVETLRANRVPHIYRLYEGEGHGFRKSETLEAYFKDIDRFLQEHVLFSA